MPYLLSCVVISCDYTIDSRLCSSYTLCALSNDENMLLITIVEVVNEAEVDQDRTKALVKQADERLVISTAEEVFVVIGCAILI